MSDEKNKTIQTDLGRAKGLGSAKDGTRHWMHQRLTALANIFLVLWLINSLIALPLTSHDIVTQWLAQPHNAILMILTVISVFTHAVLGSEVIIEDYVHYKPLKIFKLVALKLVYFALAIACVFSILKVAL